MMKSVIWSLCTTLAAVLAVTSVEAHHSFSMFDRSREEVIEGEVVRWAFNSPHVVLYMRDVQGTLWGFEGAAPVRLLERTPSANGFTFQPGDRITMIACPLYDGRPGGAIGLVVSADGTWYNPADGGCAADEEQWREWLAAGYRSKADAAMN